VESKQEDDARVFRAVANGKAEERKGRY